MNIILCGLSGVGKTTYGKMIAKKLSWSFVDTDCIVEKRFLEQTGNNYSCRQIFEKEGEKYFRSLEQSVLDSLHDVRSSVIALGGGIVDIGQLKEKNLVVHLRASNELLLQRILEKGSPAYLDKKNVEESFLQIAAKREPLYEKMSEMIINTDLFSNDEVINKIVSRL